MIPGIGWRQRIQRLTVSASTEPATAFDESKLCSRMFV
jgi:hypothetical protein